MRKKYFVYIMRSVVHPEKSYVGITSDVQRRIREHNSGSQIYSRRYTPWKLVAYVAFRHRRKAVRFERYLKTGSGKAFLKKHFLQ